MAIKILEAGLAATIQDLGRPGYYQLGIPIGGAMDRFALRVANLLVGNDESAACIESPYIGPRLLFDTDTLVSVTGADLPVCLDGKEHQTWTAIEVKAGQVLEFGYLKGGARIYIAVSGGVDVPLVLGSRSTYLVGQLGGFHGRILVAEDVLHCGQGDLKSKCRYIPEELRRTMGEAANLRVMPGLFWHRLTKTSGEGFFEDRWVVSTEADRMGVRFSGGRPMEFEPRDQPFGAGSDPSNIVDSPYPYGSVQIPSGLEPIVLHRDAVSAGGYFQIGAVISADMDILGQLQPNTPVKFVKVSMEEALQARLDEEGRLERIRDLF